MTDDDRALGRRRYDDPRSDDHDLLVRIEERLRVLPELVARVVALETWRSEVAGEQRANARTIAIIVACSTGLTALAVELVRRFGG